MTDERLAEIKELAEEDKRWLGIAGYDSTYIPELIAEVERLREHVATLEHAYKDSRERIREMEQG